jgi:hypothetical protein
MPLKLELMLFGLELDWKCYFSWLYSNGREMVILWGFLWELPPKNPINHRDSSSTFYPVSSSFLSRLIDPNFSQARCYQLINKPLFIYQNPSKSQRQTFSRGFSKQFNYQHYYFSCSLEAKSLNYH